MCESRHLASSKPLPVLVRLRLPPGLSRWGREKSQAPEHQLVGAGMEGMPPWGSAQGAPSTL